MRSPSLVPIVMAFAFALSGLAGIPAQGATRDALAEGITPAERALFAPLFEQEKEAPSFKVESVEELVRINRYHDGILADGKVTHQFKLANGQLIQCIEIGSQKSIARSGLKADNIRLEPVVLPSESKRTTVSERADPAVFGMDGSLDEDGNARRCPEGSIPKLVPSLRDLYRFRKLDDVFGKYPVSTSGTVTQQGSVPENGSARSHLAIEPPVGHEYAHAYRTVDNIGEEADFNVWRPTVERSDEFSLAQLWVVRGGGSDLQTVETGWQVYKQLYGDNAPRLFIYFTTHNYEAGYPGGYNLGAGYFVQTDSSVIIGGGLPNESVIGGSQYSCKLLFYRDTGGDHNWWLKYGDTWVGYYPNNLFDSAGLADKCARIDYGGEIVNQVGNGLHTTTDMGSGRFPSDGWQYAAYIKKIRYIDMNNAYQDASGLTRSVSDAAYYDLSLYSSTDENWGRYFYYGGTGRAGGGDDAYEENDTRASAYSFSSEGTWLSSIGGVGVQADEDWYAITVSPSGYERVQVDCRFTHDDGDIDIALYDAAGNNLASSTGSSDNEFIDYTVPSAGTYYIRVYYENAGNTYDLWWDDLYTGATLSYITVSGATEVNEDDGAQYACTAYYSDGSSADISSSASWTENSAYASIDGSGYLTAGSVSADQAFVITASYGGLSDTYDVIIRNAGSGDDAYEENDTRASAYSFSSEGTWLSSIGGVGVQADEDWYAITVSPAGYERVQVDCRFTHGNGDIDIALYDAAGNNLASSTGTSDNEFIDYTVPSAGTYYIRVYYGNTGNTYDLWWDDLYTGATLSYITVSGATEVNEDDGAQYACTAYYSDGSSADISSSASWTENSAYASIDGSGYLTAGSVSADQACVITASYGGLSDTFDIIIRNAGSGDDAYEENDTRASAYSFSSEGTWLSTIGGVGVQADEDWYAITVSPAGYERVQVDCRFTHGNGDIDIALYDAAGNNLASSSGTSDNEFIDYTVPSAGTYYIRVYYGNTGNTYDLWWDDLYRNPATPGQICLDATSYLASEGVKRKVLVRRINGSSGQVSVHYTTKPKTALAWNDYIPRSGTLTWLNGDSAAKVIKLTIPMDGRAEGNETFKIVLQAPVGATLTAPYKANITIVGNNKIVGIPEDALATRMTRLTEALNDDALTWFTSPSSPWTKQSFVTVDGDGAAVSGDSSTDRASWLQTELEGSGKLEFDCFVKGSEKTACLIFINGKLWRSLTPGYDWSHVTVKLGEDIHTVRWVFVQGSVLVPGSAFLDRVTWVRE